MKTTRLLSFLLSLAALPAWANGPSCGIYDEVSCNTNRARQAGCVWNETAGVCQASRLSPPTRISGAEELAEEQERDEP